MFRKLFHMFLQFVKIGSFTFGGGWSVIAQMNKIFVEKENSISAEELLDITSVGRSLPGVMVGNVAFLFGYRIAGYIGGVIAVLGVSLPPLCILALITFFYVQVSSNTWFAAGMSGVRAAVVPIILSAAVRMAKSAYKFKACILITAITLILYLVFKIDCIWLVLIGAFLGFLISEYYEKKGVSSSDTA